MEPIDMNPAQTITATGRIRSITVDIKKFGLPEFDIRAKIYQDIPIEFGTAFPLSNFVAQSTNVIAAEDLGINFTSCTFHFEEPEVTGQWTVIFEYENVTNHDSMNLIFFNIGCNERGTIYSGGDFWYFIEDVCWYLYPCDMIFTCDFCDLSTTTTTEEGTDTTTLIIG